MRYPENEPEVEDFVQYRYQSRRSVANPHARTYNTAASVLLLLLLAACGMPGSPGASPNAPVVSTELKYVGFGNTVLSGDGLLSGVSDPQGDPLATVAETVSSDEGGVVDIAADGTFTYTPAAGTTGDRFVYRVTDGSETTTGVVDLDLMGMVWYVDDASGPGGTGVSDSPFGTFAEAIAVAEAGSVVHVAPGTGAYEAEITLPDGVQLIGSGVDLEIAGTTVVPATTAPVIDVSLSEAFAVRFSNDNAVRGFVFDGGNSGAAHALYAPDLDSTENNVNIDVSDNTFTGFGGTITDKAMDFYEVENLTVQRNTFTNAQDTGTNTWLVDLSESTGTVSVSDNSFEGTIASHLLLITANEGRTDLTLDGNVFAPTDHPGNKYGVRIAVTGTADVSASIDGGNVFRDIGYDALGVILHGDAAASLRTVVHGNTFDNVYSGVSLDVDGDQIHHARIEDNAFVDTRSVSIDAGVDAVQVDGGFGASELHLSILSNTFDDVGIPQAADAIVTRLQNTAATGQRVVVRASGNVMTNGVANAAFRAVANGADAGNELHVTLEDNDFLFTNESTGDHSVSLSAATAAHLCVDARGNRATFEDPLGPGTFHYLVAQTDASTVDAENAATAGEFEDLQESGTAEYVGTIGVAATGCASPEAF